MTYTEYQDWQDRRQADNEEQFPWLYDRDEDAQDETETNEQEDDE